MTTTRNSNVLDIVAGAVALLITLGPLLPYAFLA